MSFKQLSALCSADGVMKLKDWTHGLGLFLICMAICVVMIVSYVDGVLK